MVHIFFRHMVSNTYQDRPFSTSLSYVDIPTHLLQCYQHARRPFLTIFRGTKARDMAISSLRGTGAFLQLPLKVKQDLK